MAYRRKPLPAPPPPPTPPLTPDPDPTRTRPRRSTAAAVAASPLAQHLCSCCGRGEDGAEGGGECGALRRTSPRLGGGAPRASCRPPSAARPCAPRRTRTEDEARAERTAPPAPPPPSPYPSPCLSPPSRQQRCGSGLQSVQGTQRMEMGGGAGRGRRSAASTEDGNARTRCPKRRLFGCRSFVRSFVRFITM